MGEQFSVLVLLNAVVVLQMPVVIKSIHKQLCLVSLGLQENTLHFILFAFSLLQDMHLILQSQTAGVLVASLK